MRLAFGDYVPVALLFTEIEDEILDSGRADQGGGHQLQEFSLFGRFRGGGYAMYINMTSGGDAESAEGLDAAGGNLPRLTVLPRQ